MIENKKSNKANLENKKSIFFLMGLVLALSLVLSAFEWKTQKTIEVMELGYTDFVPEDYVFIPSTPAEKREIPKPIVKVPYIEIVDNDAVIDEDVGLFSSEPDDVVDIDFNNPIFQANNKNKDDEILIIAEVMPEFPGGNNALLNYLAGNVNYPLIAQENGIEGKVYVSFVVDEEGNILEVALIRGVDNSLDNEAIRVVKTMPKWRPGKQGGKAVKVRYSVPINFQLQ